jgi:hypothetical protein
MKPLGKHFLFQFLNETAHGMLVSKNSGRIWIANPELENQGGLARWARVTAIGDDVTLVKEQDIVLIAPGMWTVKHEIDEVYFWKSDEEQVWAIASDESVAFDYVAKE